MRLLVINPNSTQSMTDSLESEINSLHLSSNITVDYYTAPENAPLSINNDLDAENSSNVVMENLSEDYLKVYDGILVACYSDHPLIYKLRSVTNAKILGIFQASIIYALQAIDNKSDKVAILTSVDEWEQILDNAIINFLGVGSFPNDRFVHTLAANLPILKLHEPDNYNILMGKIQNLVNKNVKIILLGCAGLSTLDYKMKNDFPNIKFVDSVKIGIKQLISFIEIGNV